MSLKVKLTSLIATFVLLCSLLTVGVFAVKNTSFNVGGKIEFNVQGIEADIELTANGVQNAEFNNDEEIGKDVLSKIQIRNTSSQSQIESMFSTWSNLDMTFAEGQTTATIEFKITNMASEEDNYIDLSAIATATTKNNARISVANNAGGVTALLKIGESATYTITFSVKDDGYSASLNDFSVNFDMQKKVLDDFPSYNAVEKLTFSCNTTTKTATLTNGASATGNVVIPTYVQKDKVVCAVTSIGGWAFYGSGLTSVIIPLSVTSIGGGAFFESDLTSITIPDSVTSIGVEAFSQCYGLTSVTIPNSLTSIKDFTFDTCSSLTSLTIPDSVTSIEEGVFVGCISLKSITIGNGLTSIGRDAFNDCSKNLTSIVVESGNTVYDSRNNCNAIIETSSNTLILGCKETVILDSVTSIGDFAFFGCDSLTSITIPDSVTSIGDYVFENCSGLTSIVVESGNRVYDSRNNCNAIIETATNTLIAGCKNTIIPNNITSIGDYAFAGCENLTSITIPDSVTSIGEWAFSSSGLTSVVIGNGVTSIGDDAFRGCSSLTSITIPDKVTSIGDRAFRDCTYLTTVYYTGTQEQWNALLENIGSNNDYLKNATLVVG